MKPDIGVLKSIWANLGLRAQCVFIEHIVLEIKQSIIKDYFVNFEAMRVKGNFSASYLQKIDLKSYLLNREKRVVSIILTIIGKTVENSNDCLPQAVLLLGFFYYSATASVTPIR